METYKQARDLLEWVRTYHRRMKEAYGDAAESAADERKAMLLRYLENHEALFERSIDEAITENDGVLDAWIQFTPDKEMLEPIEAAEVKPDISVEELVRNAQRMDGTLMEFYQDAIERVKSKPAREFFEQLLTKQESDRAKLAEHLQSTERGV